MSLLGHLARTASRLPLPFATLVHRCPRRWAVKSQRSWLSSSLNPAIAANTIEADESTIAQGMEQEVEMPVGDLQEHQKAIPPTPNFYSGHAQYYDQLATLEKALGTARGALKELYLDPLPRFALDSITFPQPYWSTRQELSTFVSEVNLKSKLYNQFLKPLNELHRLRTIATTAGATSVSEMINNAISPYESESALAKVTSGSDKRPPRFDEHGRVQVRGRRKTSHARVWMIRSKESLHVTPSTAVEIELGLNHHVEPLDLTSPQSSNLPVFSSSIVVNNMSVANFFQTPADRDRIMRPLKVAGVLGCYNIFAVVRGGGMTGQSGALAHGIAKALVAFEPHLQDMFKKSRINYRDPRMVERKKTNLLGARSARQWVKR